MAGRKTKLTPEITKGLENALIAGNYVEPSCARIGITYQTFLNWMKRGEREGKGEYFEFFDTVSRAMAIPEIKAVAVWMKATDEDWRAAAEFLSRRFPDRWGRQRHDVNIISDPYSDTIKQLREKRELPKNENG